MIRAILTLWVLLSCGLIQAFAEPITEGPDWKDFGRQFLSYSGKQVVFDAQDLVMHKSRVRCVKMNNYGCIMGNDWNGGVGNDSAGHRVFEHPKWSVRAVVRDYCSKYKKNRRTALAIAEAYSPWCDTHGTKDIVGGWGRSCKEGVQPPKSFSGPFCSKPENGAPTKAQCSNCNCPNEIANAMVSGLGVAPDDDLQLFESDGRPNASRLGTVLRNKFRQEIGFIVAGPLIEDGIKLAGDCK